MLWTIVVVLLVLWALGLVTNVAGGIIHFLLVLAIVMAVISLFRGGRTAI